MTPPPAPQQQAPPKADTDVPRPPKADEGPAVIEKVLDKNNYNPAELDTDAMEKARYDYCSIRIFDFELIYLFNIKKF